MLHENLVSYYIPHMARMSLPPMAKDESYIPHMARKSIRSMANRLRQPTFICNPTLHSEYYDP